MPGSGVLQRSDAEKGPEPDQANPAHDVGPPEGGGPHPTPEGRSGPGQGQVEEQRAEPDSEDEDGRTRRSVSDAGRCRPAEATADNDNPHIRNGLYRWGAAYDYPASGFDTESGVMIAYQGLTAFAVNPDNGLQKMLDAFPSSIFVDNFESGDEGLWSPHTP